jgi:hypothetical protein
MRVGTGSFAISFVTETGPMVRSYPQTPIDRNPRPANIATFPVAERICRKPDRFDATGMP